MEPAVTVVAAAAAAGAAIVAFAAQKSFGSTAASRDAAAEQLDLSRLLRRLVGEDGLGTRERAIAAVGEYRRFLRLARLHPGESLQCSAAVDAVWQRHLLDTKDYQRDCIALFGAHAHRLYPRAHDGRAAGVALARTRELYAATYGAAALTECEDLWAEVPVVPALISVSVSAALPSPLAPPPVKARAGEGKGVSAALAAEDLEWLGVAVAEELPLKQSKCKHAEPLRQIAIGDPAAAVKEYKRFISMMIGGGGAWFTPSKLVLLLLLLLLPVGESSTGYIVTRDAYGVERDQYGTERDAYGAGARDGGDPAVKLCAVILLLVVGATWFAYMSASQVIAEATMELCSDQDEHKACHDGIISTQRPGYEVINDRGEMAHMGGHHDGGVYVYQDYQYTSEGCVSCGGCPVANYWEKRDQCGSSVSGDCCCIMCAPSEEVQSACVLLTDCAKSAFFPIQVGLGVLFCSCFCLMIYACCCKCKKKKKQKKAENEKQKGAGAVANPLNGKYVCLGRHGSPTPQARRRTLL